MKYLILSAILLTACSDNGTIYSVSPELSTYVDAFYSEAALRGVNPPKNFIVKLGQCQAITDISLDGEQYILTFDKAWFEAYNSEQIEAIIFHELGKIVLGREIIETAKFNDPNPVSIMNPYYKFSYGAADRSVLLDELFK